MTPVRFEGTLTQWNDDRGFGHVQPTLGGEPVFVHISAWPKGGGRPRMQQPISFEVETGPKGKRARNVRIVQIRQTRGPSRQAARVQWGTATLFAIPAFLILFTAVSVLWRPPMWVAALYGAASMVTFVVYAADKAAAMRNGSRVPERTLHLLSLAGGWPGALVAQQVLRHKSSKREFRQVFWATIALNQIGFLVLASPAGRLLLDGL